jgi:hypothetical protein
MTNIGLLLFAALAVGAPYSFFMHQACGSSSVSELVSDTGAFYSGEGC